MIKGEGVDAAGLTACIRKKVNKYAELISVAKDPWTTLKRYQPHHSCPVVVMIFFYVSIRFVVNLESEL